MIFNYQIYKPNSNRIFLKDIEDTEKYLNCPACQKFVDYDLVSLFSGKNKISLTVCDQCGHTYYRNFLSKKYIDNYYIKDFSASKLLNKKEIEKIHYTVKNSNRMYLLIKNKLKNINEKKILEIGCGNGACLSYLNSKGFKNIFGNEMNKARVENASKIPNTIIYEGGYEKIPNQKFDIIYSNHVIEHILDINNFFEKLIKISHNNTIIIFNLPDEKYENVFNKIFFIGHAHSFNYNSFIFLSKRFDLNLKFLNPLRKDEISIVLSKNKEMLKNFIANESIEIQSPEEIKNSILKPFINSKNDISFYTIDRTARYNNFPMQRRKDTFLKISKLFSVIMYLTLILYKIGEYLNIRYLERIADFFVKIGSNKKILHQGYIKLQMKDLNSKENVILNNANCYIESK